jgi:hypothetical protein
MPEVLTLGTPSSPQQAVIGPSVAVALTCVGVTALDASRDALAHARTVNNKVPTSSGRINVEVN